jgi:hypothetical protein
MAVRRSRVPAEARDHRKVSPADPVAALDLTVSATDTLIYVTTVLMGLLRCIRVDALRSV